MLGAAILCLIVRGPRRQFANVDPSYEGSWGDERLHHITLVSGGERMSPSSPSAANCVPLGSQKLPCLVLAMLWHQLSVCGAH